MYDFVIIITASYKYDAHATPMNADAPRHGALADFLALTDGLSIAKVATILRCCTRTVRNYVAGRSPIPWHRLELLRLLALESNAPAVPASCLVAEPVSDIAANIDPDPTACGNARLGRRACAALPVQPTKLHALCSWMKRRRQDSPREA